MILKVNKDICEIKQNEVWNVGDYNVHTVQVELSEEFDGLVNKVRYFVEENSYDMLITDNIAEVPREATLAEGMIRIGVYGYDADTDILVQSTSPVNKYISSGTYTGEADNTEPLTPTDKQQMETQIQQNADDIDDLKESKQDVLISGTNIKTINNESILGSGNMEIQSGEPLFINSPAYSITNQDITSWDNKADKSDIPDVSNFITKNVNDLTYYTNSTDMQTAINNAVGVETQNRELADTGLQNQIDAITASSDVIDILGTYQDLVNYDTTHVKENDIIKVLQDSTHGNAISYYRWVITNHVGAWVYVGSEGPYYTKGETDTLLNAKQNTLISGTNIKTVNNESILQSGNITVPVKDNYTITNNSNNQLQTVGIIEQNAGNIVKYWEGTQAQYDAISTKDNNTVYYITDAEDNYIKNTDYATSSVAGVIKASSTYGFSVSNTGIPSGESYTYSQYGDKDTKSFISKGTLENVITGKGLGTYSKPSGGIPATDLTTSVQNTLTKADNQVWYGTQAQYDAISQKNPDTLYCIVES